MTEDIFGNFFLPVFFLFFFNQRDFFAFGRRSCNLFSSQSQNRAVIKTGAKQKQKVPFFKLNVRVCHSTASLFTHCPLSLSPSLPFSPSILHFDRTLVPPSLFPMCLCPLCIPLCSCVQQARWGFHVSSQSSNLWFY